MDGMKNLKELNELVEKMQFEKELEYAINRLDEIILITES